MPGVATASTRLDEQCRFATFGSNLYYALKAFLHGQLASSAADDAVAAHHNRRRPLSPASGRWPPWGLNRHEPSEQATCWSSTARSLQGCLRCRCGLGPRAFSESMHALR